MIEQSYPEGIDCVWLASDTEGHLGVFITAGCGPIPEQVLESTHIPIEDVESRLCELPRMSKAQLLVSIKRPDDFVDLAERGLFVYDWTDINRTALEALHAYELVAVPSKPITMSSLPADLASLAKAAILTRVIFVTRQSVGEGALESIETRR